MSAASMTYWGAVAFAVIGIVAWARALRIWTAVGARLDEETRVLAQIEERMAATEAAAARAERYNRDFAEALALAQYGARDEAIEILTRWETEPHAP